MQTAAEIMRPAAGWPASLRLGFRATPARTLLAERRRQGPLAVQRAFYPERGVCHVYLLHPPGGVVGGDSLCMDIELGRDAQALLTTPGATKFYRSAGEQARQVQHLRVAAGAAVEWLPQENIFFPGAEVALDTRIELQHDARLVFWEIHCLGRPAIGEGFDRGRLDSRLGIFRDGRPLLLERQRLDGTTRARRALMAGQAVGATLLVSPAGNAELAACRGCLPAAARGGATLIGDLLVVRHLGDSTEQVRRLFAAIWRLLRPATLGRAACPPRIWST